MSRLWTLWLWALDPRRPSSSSFVFLRRGKEKGKERGKKKKEMATKTTVMRARMRRETRKENRKTGLRKTASNSWGTRRTKEVKRRKATKEGKKHQMMNPR